MPTPDMPQTVVLPDDVRDRLLRDAAIHGPATVQDLAPVLARIDELIVALHAHTVAVYQWADSCNALLNAMLASAEDDDADYITDLKGNRIPIHATPHAHRTTKP